MIRQDEYGNFMVVLLTGTIAVDRMQPWGEQLRLAETRPATSWAKCRCWTAASVFRPHHADRLRSGVLSAEAMDEMMTKDPRLAASLVPCWRKLSLRLRVVSARLSETRNDETKIAAGNSMERDQASKFINDLLKLMVSRGGSDLFITASFRRPSRSMAR